MQAKLMATCLTNNSYLSLTFGWGFLVSNYNGAFMHWLFVDRKLHSISMTEAIAYDRYCWAVVDDYPNEHRVDYVPVWQLLHYAWWCFSH